MITRLHNRMMLKPAYASAHDAIGKVLANSPQLSIRLPKNLLKAIVMTDRRPLLRALYDAAVAAAHPNTVLAPHLRPVPAGRVICLAAGKGAGAMAAAAERHYLDTLNLAPERLGGVGPTRPRDGGAPRPHRAGGAG